MFLTRKFSFTKPHLHSIPCCRRSIPLKELVLALRFAQFRYTLHYYAYFTAVSAAAY